MPSSVSLGPAAWMDGPTYNGLILRPIFSGLLVAQAAQVMSGVLPSGGALSVSAGSGMSVNVATGSAVIASSAGLTNGGYNVASLTSVSLTVAASDPVNPRIDLVCVTISDVGSSADTWLLQVVAGTPAGSPSAPALPASSLALATVLVPALSSSVTSGNITDQRVWTAAQGGIIPVPNLTSGVAALTPYQGMYLHDRNTLRLARLGTTGNVLQPFLLPFVPQQARRTSTLASSGQVCAVNVTTDGLTDIEVQIGWPYLFINNAATYGEYEAELLITVDSNPIRQITVPAATAASTVGGGPGSSGGGLTHVTQSGTDRLSAGTHSVGFEMVSIDDGTHSVQMQCTSLAFASIYVRAVPL